MPPFQLQEGVDSSFALAGFVAATSEARRGILRPNSGKRLCLGRCGGPSGVFAASTFLEEKNARNFGEEMPCVEEN